MQVPMGILSFTYLTFLFSLTMVVFAVEAGIDPFSEALLSLKSELRMEDSGSLSDWLLPENPSCDKICACSWSGVNCNSNSSAIVGLNLSMKNLGGTLSGKQFNVFSDLVDLNLSHNSFSDQLPVGIFNLTNLRSLDISRNNFSGQFPKGISNLRNLVVLDAFSNSFSGTLPADVSELEVLKVLNFAGSYFSGPIPSEYGSFKSLDFIHLAGNFLTGKLPPELGLLRTVTHMEIGYNTYEGGIPWEFGNMSSLQYLDIAGANLSGPIPKKLSNLTNLDTIFLFRNQLLGEIPWEFCNILPLQSLDLSDNLLSGPIPESFSDLKNLKLLSLMYNDMNGTVPEGIAKLPQLDTLLIWNNFFTGSLPEDLGRYSKLKYVDVSTNNLVGRLPPNICSGGTLERLILFSNKFSGELSPSLSNCSALVRLRVEDNSFSGEISFIFTNLSDISYIDISRNKFIGGLPNDLSAVKASKIQYLNMSNNPELGGLIPEKLWSLPVLHNFSASSCAISGNLPQFDLCSRSVLVIDLSQNLLSGILPDSVANCHGLKKLDLSKNNLTGHIPVSLATLPAITELDISHNSFTGPIPSQFGNSSSLKLLNLSFNDISGSIPREKSFKTMDISAFLGNPKLCGAPLLRLCHRGKTMPSEIELGSRRTQKLAWVLITCAAVMLFVTTAVFALLYLRKRSKSQWKMVTFTGLPEFTANDVLKSFNSALLPNNAVCKAVLQTGITVSVKKIELEGKGMGMELMLQFLRRIGNTRHNHLISLIGFCYIKNQAYLLYDYLPNGNLAEKIKSKKKKMDWSSKYKIIIGIARGLFFLHHDCYPAIPHGELKSSNVMFDENMEPRLAEYGLSSLYALNTTNHLGSSSTTGLFLNFLVLDYVSYMTFSFFFCF